MEKQDEPIEAFGKLLVARQLLQEVKVDRLIIELVDREITTRRSNVKQDVTEVIAAKDANPELTYSERKFFETVSCKPNQLVTFDDIAHTLWNISLKHKPHKHGSINGFAAKVKRKMIHLGTLTNVHGQGYMWVPAEIISEAPTVVAEPPPNTPH